jgi:hypothetical protein
LQGDPEANLCHFALQKLHMFPHEILNLPDREKAFVYASIQVRIEQEKKEAAKIQAAKGKRGGRRK